jgi:hypothetical protein
MIFALNDVVRVDHKHVAPLLARPDRVILRQQRLVLLRNRYPDAHEEARDQHLILILEQRARRGVELRRDIVEISLVRMTLLIL